jgi:hypothetical protein
LIGVGTADRDQTGGTDLEPVGRGLALNVERLGGGVAKLVAIGCIGLGVILLAAA